MSTRKLSFGLFATLLVSCRSADRDPQTGELSLGANGVGGAGLPGEVLALGELIGTPRTMAIVGGQLWIADRNGDPFIHLIDIRTRRHVVSYGRAGEGPGAFSGVMSVSRRGDEAWAYDHQLRRLTRLEPDPGMHEATIVGAPADVLPMDMQWLSPDRVVVIGHSDSNRVMILDSTGNRLVTLAAPLLGADSIPREARASLSSGFIMCVAPGGRRFAIGYVGASRIELFDSAGRFERVADVVSPSNGEFEKREDGTWRGRTEKRHYESCSATESHLYMLYGGREALTPAQRRTPEAIQVQAFRWTGEREATWEVDRPLRLIAVDGDSVLYGAVSETGEIASFRLADVPRPSGSGPDSP